MMRLRLNDRRTLAMAAAALAGGLAAAALYVWFLGGLAFCTGEWGNICRVGFYSAVFFFLCGAALRGVVASWLRVHARGFRQLYALNILLGVAMAVAVFWTLLDLATGPGRAAVCAGGLALLAVGLLVFLNHAAEDDRFREMAELARRLGLTFSRRDSLGLGNRLRVYRPFGPGSGGEACNLIHGTFNGRALLAFDYLHPSDEGPRPGPLNDLHGDMSVAAFSFPECCLPGCLVVPRAMLGTISRAVQQDEIAFESHEFNKQYGVWGLDRKFAYDVIDPRMMEFLLANPGWAFEVAGCDVMVYTGKRWAMDEFDPAIRALTGFVDHIPGHVWAEWRSLSKGNVLTDQQTALRQGPRG